MEAKVGEQEAERIKNVSSARGTSMHNTSSPLLPMLVTMILLNWDETAKPMAEKIMEVGLAPVSEYFGSEVTLHYPGLYAGQTDLTCLPQWS